MDKSLKYIFYRWRCQRRTLGQVVNGNSYEMGSKPYKKNYAEGFVARDQTTEWNTRCY